MELSELSAQYKILLFISVFFVAKLFSVAILKVHKFTTENFNSSEFYVELPGKSERKKEENQSILFILPLFNYFAVLTGNCDKSKIRFYITGAYLEIIFIITQLRALNVNKSALNFNVVIDTLLIMIFVACFILFCLRGLSIIYSHEDIWVVDAEDYLLPNNNPDVKKQIKTLWTINKIKRFFFVK